MKTNSKEIDEEMLEVINNALDNTKKEYEKEEVECVHTELCANCYRITIVIGYDDKEYDVIGETSCHCNVGNAFHEQFGVDTKDYRMNGISTIKRFLKGKSCTEYEAMI